MSTCDSQNVSRRCQVSLGRRGIVAPDWEPLPQAFVQWLFQAQHFSPLRSQNSRILYHMPWSSFYSNPVSHLPLEFEYNWVGPRLRDVDERELFTFKEANKSLQQGSRCRWGSSLNPLIILLCPFCMILFSHICCFFLSLVRMPTFGGRGESHARAFFSALKKKVPFPSGTHEVLSWGGAIRLLSSRWGPGENPSWAHPDLTGVRCPMWGQREMAEAELHSPGAQVLVSRSWPLPSRRHQHWAIG